ncbi:MAG: flagellar hook basal-body protein [Tepidisphaera sp.]
MCIRMDLGVSLSTSGALTAMYRMDVLSNNLANVSTAGFKPDLPIAKQRDVVRREDGIDMPSNELLERLGGGVHQGRTRVRFSQGALVAGGDLDCALQGDGFFVVRESGSSAGDQLRLTRNGRFAVDARNRLVMADSGLPVMSASNDVITIDPRKPVTINTDGKIVQGNSEVGFLKVVDVPNPDGLTKSGNMFKAPAEALQSKTKANALVRQGQVEQSTVDPLQATMQISNAARAVESNLNVMTYSDRMMERAINTLGRPS